MAGAASPGAGPPTYGQGTPMAPPPAPSWGAPAASGGGGGWQAPTAPAGPGWQAPGSGYPGPGGGSFQGGSAFGPPPGSGYPPPPGAGYGPPPGGGYGPSAGPSVPVGSGSFDLMAAIKRPSQDPDALAKIGICGAIMLVPLVGGLFAQGYTLRYLQRILRIRDGRLPEWVDWGDIFMGGLFYFLISLVFGLVPLIVGGALMVPAIMGIVHSAGSSHPDISLAGILVPVAITALLGIAVMIPLPMAACRYAETGNFGAAFEFGELFRLVTASIGQYLMILVGLFLCGLGLGVVFIVLNIVPILGQLAGFALMLMGSAFLQLASASAFGEYYLQHRRGA